MRRTEVRFAGEGGQGLILAAVVLAETAASLGLSVVQSEQYGPESRGGHTWADVIVSDEEVVYPQATQLDVLVALSGKGIERSLRLVRPEGLLVADCARLTAVDAGPERRMFLPLTEITRKASGRAVPANMAALGALAALTGLVPLEALADAAVGRVPRGTEAANRRALEAGYQAARDAS